MGRSNERRYTFWPSGIVVWSSISGWLLSLYTLGVPNGRGRELIRAQLQVDGEIRSHCDRQGTRLAMVFFPRVRKSIDRKPLDGSLAHPDRSAGPLSRFNVVETQEWKIDS
jgi:hypothetical protein